MAAAFFLITILVVAAPSAYAVEHVVGGSTGWSNSGDYDTWASGATFKVGDTLLFNYGTSHGVDVLSKSDYDNCATSNSISSFTGGTTSIKLTQPGPMYFACPTIGHCSLGMKMSINVVAADTTPTTPTTPSGGSNPSPPSSTTPSTPSTSNPTPRGSSTNSPYNGATDAPGSINMLLVGFSLLLAPVIALMC